MTWFLYVCFFAAPFFIIRARRADRRQRERRERSSGPWYPSPYTGRAYTAPPNPASDWSLPNPVFTSTDDSPSSSSDTSSSDTCSPDSSSSDYCGGGGDFGGGGASGDW